MAGAVAVSGTVAVYFSVAGCGVRSVSFRAAGACPDVCDFPCACACDYACTCPWAGVCGFIRAGAGAIVGADAGPSVGSATANTVI